ncbi:unnamed protein product [Penicillium roqueforti FM164]|uniref:Genomic scaffold, ProqFM164S01 n=1 Tax=Penicillium roqueforti (strain FM164) TaxID=1365484 RepID=W6PR32_PENRF|nr:unnamed protein product [Penicillium roqueforti FM164]
MDAAGRPTMAKLVKQAPRQYPNIKALFGEWSQTAIVVHHAVQSLTADMRVLQA